MKFSKKLAIAAIPAVMAMSAPQNVNSKLLLMSQEGWEVSFDGAANAFYTHNAAGAFDDATDTNLEQDQATSANTSYTREGDYGVNEEGEDSSNIQVGLLPNVWGMTLKAPTTGGLDMQARIGFYTHIQGGSTASAWNSNGLINNRETNFSVSGDFGTVLMGRTLRLYQQTAILNDQTLFGVGTFAGDSADTTLGRIGAGYLYANFGSQIQWTTPGLGPIGLKVSVNTPEEPDGDDTNFETSSPAIQFIADVSYDLGGLGTYVWFDGHYQYANFTTTGGNTYQDSNGRDNNGAASTSERTAKDGVEVGGLGTGIKLNYANLSFVGAGFFNSGMGMTLGYTGGFDNALNPINYGGYYAQLNVDLGGGTNVGYSWGQNERFGNKQTQAERIATTAPVIAQEHHNAMVWHNVNDNFRLIAEGGYTETRYFQAGSADATTLSLGAFFFW